MKANEYRSVEDVNVIKDLLEKCRKELLDTGLRANPLLNYRKGAKTLSIVDEKAVEIFKILVTKNKTMSFLPAPDKAIEEKEKSGGGFSWSAFFDQASDESRYVDQKLQTALSADKLGKKLTKIHTESESFLKERGIDILYLAIGFLSWYEADASQRENIAPLILIPVNIVRRDAKDKYKLKFSGAEIMKNHNLYQKLRGDFGLEFPDVTEDTNVTDFFTESQDLIRGQKRWKIDQDQIELGLFSFSKLQMYEDLNAKKWPENKQPGNHPVLRGLFSKDGFATLDLPESDATEPTSDVKVVNLSLVLDADSSQTEAVVAVNNGNHLIIEGPPGTGKSQTITNIIAESLSQNKKILFVAEKMAALEVVKRRLDKCHLGNAALELHSHKSNKKDVYSELRRTLLLEKPVNRDQSYVQEKYLQLEKDLNQYSNSVNSPILNSGLTFNRALGYYLGVQEKLKDKNVPEPIPFESIRDWSETKLKRILQSTDSIGIVLKDMGPLYQRAFRGSKLKKVSPTDLENLTRQIKSTSVLFNEVIRNSQEISKTLGLGTSRSANELKILNHTVRLAKKCTHTELLKLQSEAWLDKSQDIHDLFSALARMHKVKKKWRHSVQPELWTKDIYSITFGLLSANGFIKRTFNKDYKGALARLNQLLKKPIKPNSDEWKQLLEDMQQFQKDCEDFEDRTAIGDEIMVSETWETESYPWDELVSVSGVIREIHEAVRTGTVFNTIFKLIQDQKIFDVGDDLVDTTQRNLDHLSEQFRAVTLALKVEGQDDTFQLKVFDQAELLLEIWANHIDLIYKIPNLNSNLSKLKEAGLQSFVVSIISWPSEPDLISDYLRYSWLHGLLEEQYRNDQKLMFFDRNDHTQKVEEFKKLDQDLFHFSVENLNRQHYSMIPSQHAAGEMSFLRHEMNKKRRHSPIRKLLENAGRVIQATKPVFLMSPMSVAAYLKQGGLEFDLVVFDEASQVKVVDALGPILRGKQVVVVGDTKQMPPTDFFGKALDPDADDDDENQTSDIESILSLFRSKGVTDRMLRWHYRSRHETLIQISNAEFYDNNLLIFPTPGSAPHTKGLSLKYLPDTSYDKGGSKTNLLEAKAVADAVMQHAAQTPHLSLGVVAFSSAQRDCILDQLEYRRRVSNQPDKFFIEHHDGEEFFVKNLENVQGDERDVIMISIGYGRDQSGRLSQNFGPLTRDGGERRLNVLITRAKCSMVVFCNFKGDDLVIRNTTGKGIKAFKNFLRFAETKVMEVNRITNRGVDSPFEAEVLRHLTYLGYDVQPQVGCSGFFIDLAIRDPKNPGKFILAVECDGATYHSSKSARERDRLRQSILENFGWRFYRIWSTDWFRNAARAKKDLADEVKKVIEEVRHQEQVEEERQKREAEQKVTEQNQAIEPEFVEKPEQDAAQVTSEQEADEEPEVEKHFYQTLAVSDLSLPNQEVTATDLNLIAEALSKIVAYEGPIHIDYAAKRITEASGFKRTGAKISAYVNRAANLGFELALFTRKDTFLYPNQWKTVVRDRSKLESGIKKLEWISPEEILCAVLSVVESAISISVDDAILPSLNLLGFKKSGAKSRTHLIALINSGIEEGKLNQEDDRLVHVPRRDNEEIQTDQTDDL